MKSKLFTAIAKRLTLVHLCTGLYVGVGDGSVLNRYCLVGYGGIQENEPGHFITVDGQPCYSASDFPRAPIQLMNTGLVEDGYEAIQFAIDNIPFRDSPFIAKNIILITDEGRSVIPQGENITREIIQAELKVLCMYTVEPPNKGHVGNNINLIVLSFVKRLSSYRRFSMY